MEESFTDVDDVLGVGIEEQDEPTFFFDEEEENYRCVQLDLVEHNDQLNRENYPSKNQTNENKPEEIRRPATLSEDEVGNQWIALVGDVPTIAEGIEHFLTDSAITFAVFGLFEFVGYLFKDSSYAFFQIVVYTREEDNTLALKITRLSGDAFIISDMYKQLREYMLSRELVSEENDPWCKDVESYECLDGLPNLSDDESDEEEMEEPTPISKFLQLKYDLDMVPFWMNDMLENPYYDQKLHTMMTVAHNSENVENVQLMLEHSEGKFFEGVNNVLKDSKSFPMARSCAKTIENIMANSDANIDWPLVNTICDNLMLWSEDPKSKPPTYNRPIRNSTEIQTTLASSLNQFTERFDSENTSEVPEYVKDKIDEVKTWLENDRCAPEAFANMECFVQNMTPILGY